MPYLVDVHRVGAAAAVGMLRRLGGLELRDPAETLAVLRAARSMVAGGWAPCLSRDTAGAACASDAEGVARYCSSDALYEAAAHREGPWVEAEAFMNALTPSWLGDWEAQGGRTQADVVAIFDRAILRAAALGRTNAGRTHAA